MPADLYTYSGWIGLALLSLIFLATALGIVDPTRAVRELANVGLPYGLSQRARELVGAGRLLQLAAVPALFFGSTRVPAALALIGFLGVATLTGHAFWRAAPAERGPQLVDFLKNLGLIGGLLVVAGWRTQT